jgi:nicotinate-nucleotide pyrophosphorylase (carboxylating)
MIPHEYLQHVVKSALLEDIGTGDITTALTIPAKRVVSAGMVSRSDGIVAGMPIVEEVYRQLAPDVTVFAHCEDGSEVSAGTVMCTIQGDASVILTGERVALNFVQRLCGIASLTRKFVILTEGTSARIVDTRKTTPGIRALEKYAVRCGGGHNHRYGLYDAVLIKDNHIVACGSITAAVALARSGAPHTMTITVECDTLQQAEEALQADADILLLDNMPTSTLKQAVERIAKRAVVEASGGVSLNTVAEIASTGVDIISVGALTHSAVSLDIGLDIEIVP